MQHPSVTYEDGSWITTAPFTYGDIQIPEGFRCDLASIPRFIWGIIAPFELSLSAPLVHDWLYRHGGKLHNRTYTRAEADKLFLQIMEEEHIALWRRRSAYAAVRLFGGKAFQG